MQSTWRLAPALLAWALCLPAEAKVTTHTNILYFNVEGRTLAEIYKAILDRGPRVSGARALASIGTRATQDGGLTQKDGSCRVTDYVISLEFDIQRPRIANEQVLPPEDRALWQRMNGFLAAHENQHKIVWEACAADLDQRIAVLAFPDCKELAARAEALWNDMLARCDKTQRSFDAAQSKALLEQPFMERALKSAQ